MNNPLPLTVLEVAFVAIALLTIVMLLLVALLTVNIKTLRALRAVTAELRLTNIKLATNTTRTGELVRIVRETTDPNQRAITPRPVPGPRTDETPHGATVAVIRPGTNPIPASPTPEPDPEPATGRHHRRTP